VRLLSKNPDRGMPHKVVREENESLNIRIKGDTHLRSGRHYQDPAKYRLPNPTSLYQWRECLTCRKCDNSPKSAACECRWGRIWRLKAHISASADIPFDTHNVTMDPHPGASCV